MIYNINSPSCLIALALVRLQCLQFRDAPSREMAISYKHRGVRNDGWVGIGIGTGRRRILPKGAGYRGPHSIISAPLAQRLERQSYKPYVDGSIPAGLFYLYVYLIGVRRSRRLGVARMASAFTLGASV